MGACHRCGIQWTDQGPPGFNNTCSGCGMPLHSCRNCVHFVARGALRCLMPGTPEVRDPAEGNRCNAFVLGGVAPKQEGLHGDPDAAREAWDRLFGEGQG